MQSVAKYSILTPQNETGACATPPHFSGLFYAYAQLRTAKISGQILFLGKLLIPCHTVGIKQYLVNTKDKMDCKS